MSAHIRVTAINKNHKRSLIVGVYNGKGIDHLDGEVFSDTDYSTISKAVIDHKRMDNGYEVSIDLSTELSIMGGLLPSYTDTPRKFNSINGVLHYVSRKMHEINLLSAVLTAGYNVAVNFKDGTK